MFTDSKSFNQQNLLTVQYCPIPYNSNYQTKYLNGGLGK